MPTENIRVVVQGPNAQTFTVQANVPNNGTTTVNLPLTGVNLGVDILQAFMDSKNLSSNQAQVVWQSTNGAIAVSPVSVYFQRGGGNSWIPPGMGSSGFSNVLTVDSLMFNTHPKSILPGDPHDSGNQAVPMVNNATTVTGTYSGDVAIPGDTGGEIYLALVGSFVVRSAGTIDFTSYTNAGYIIGCPGATFAGGVATFGGVTATPIKGYASLAGRNGVWPGGTNTQVDNFSLHFPSPGVYPFEIIFVSGPASERQFDLLANSVVIPPINLATVPQPPAAGTGNLILTPNSAGPDVQGQTQQFTLTISGVQFTSTPYIPVLEGKSGKVYIANSGTGFNFPALAGGGNVNYTAAIAALLGLSGDNGEWQGRVSIGTDGNDFTLNFNGAAVDPNVAATELTVTQKDLAWFNASNNSFDAYGISSQGGGTQATVQVNWLVMPSIASIGPTSLPGDGARHTVAVNLAKPLPPVQTNIQATFTGSGGLTVNSATLNLNSAGWVTGWTLTVTTPVVGSSTTVGLSLNATGALTYLDGTGFTTETVTYINGQIGTISV